MDEDCHTLADVARLRRAGPRRSTSSSRSAGASGRPSRWPPRPGRSGSASCSAACSSPGSGSPPGAQIASLCDHVDLDGNLLLADDPWPGVDVRRTACRSRPTSRASVSEKRYLILAEGVLARPALREDDARRRPLPPRPEVVAILDSQRAGEEYEGVPIVGSVADGAAVRADDRARRRRRRGRAARPGVARAPPRRGRGRARRRGRDARVPRRRPRARRARARAGRRAPRPAPPARRPERPDGREPDARRDASSSRSAPTARSGRRRWRSSSTSRPQRRGAALRLRPDGPDGDHDRGLGDRRRRGRRGLPRGRGRAARRRGSEPRRPALGRGPGRAPPPAVLGRDARPLHGARRTRSSSATSPGTTEIEGVPRPRDPAARRARRAVRARSRSRRGRRAVAAIALNTSLLGRGGGARGRRGGRAETGLVADDPVRFGAGRLVEAVLAHVPHGPAPLPPGIRPGCAIPESSGSADLSSTTRSSSGEGQVVRIDGYAIAAPLALALYRAALARRGAARTRTSTLDGLSGAPRRRGLRRADRLPLAGPVDRDRGDRRARDDLVGDEHAARFTRVRRAAARRATSPRSASSRTAAGSGSPRGRCAGAGRSTRRTRTRRTRTCRSTSTRRSSTRACHTDKDDPAAHWRCGRRDARRPAPTQLASVAASSGSSGPTPTCASASAGRTWIAADGRYNMPDGEVFTSPVETETEGEIRFTLPGDLPGPRGRGRAPALRGRPRRRRGGLHAARPYLRELLDLDAGARVLGEVAFGLNYEIDRFTRNILLDEKIGGTMHVALGAGFAAGRRQELVRPPLGPDLRPPRGRRGLRGRRARLEGGRVPRRSPPPSRWRAPVPDPRVERLADVARQVLDRRPAGRPRRRRRDAARGAARPRDVPADPRGGRPSARCGSAIDGVAGGAAPRGQRRRSSSWVSPARVRGGRARRRPHRLRGRLQHALALGRRPRAAGARPARARSGSATASSSARRAGELRWLVTALSDARGRAGRRDVARRVRGVRLSAPASSTGTTRSAAWRGLRRALDRHRRVARARCASFASSRRAPTSRLGVDGRTWIASRGPRELPRRRDLHRARSRRASRARSRSAYPATFQGRVIEGVRLRFEGGEVVEATAETRAGVPARRCSRSTTGARRVGEFAFGMNDAITEFTLQHALRREDRRHGPPGARQVVSRDRRA